MLESAAYYVNPYDVNSICQGMNVMTEKKVLDDYRDRIIKYKAIINLRVEYSDRNFVKEFNGKEDKTSLIQF